MPVHSSTFEKKVSKVPDGQFNVHFAYLLKVILMLNLKVVMKIMLAENENQISIFRSIVGGLAWLATTTKPTLLAAVSLLASRITAGTVSNLNEAITVVKLLDVSNNTRYMLII